METSAKKEVLDWIKTIGIAVLFVVMMRTFIFSPILVDGASMMPTYEDKDRVIVNKINAHFVNIERFDVVVFDALAGKDYIKRVIGLPGDHIAYKDDTLYVNGEAVAEPYLNTAKKQLQTGVLTQNFTLEDVTGDTVIPEGYIFVLGDNRKNSLDSRDARLGLVAIDNVIGTASMTIYPFQNIGIAN